MTDVRKMACWSAAGFIGTALIIVAASPAHSQPPVEVIAQKNGMTQVVHFGDLSLATREGRHMLVSRVGYAVRKVCPGYEESWVLYDVEGCRKFAWQGARPQMRRAYDRALSGSSLTMTSVTITARTK